MTAETLGTKKDPFLVNAVENYAKKYILHPYLSFNIHFLYHNMPYVSPLRCLNILFGKAFRKQKSFSVFSRTL